MAKARSTRKGSGGGRGSVEAIGKRRAARHLNAIFTGGAKQGRGLDGRTEKRRRRLLKELKEGKSGKALKPIEVVSHTHELLELGETLSSLRKAGIKPSRLEVGGDHMDAVTRAQTEYNFRAEAWKMLGVDIAGGDAERKKAKGAGRGRRKKA